MRDRFFVEGVHAVGDVVAFAPDDARKLATVLRKRSGDRAQVVDSGGAALGGARGVAGVGARRGGGARGGGAVGGRGGGGGRRARGGAEPALRVTVAQACRK